MLTGIAVLSSASAAATTGLVHVVLRDQKHLDETEREARKVGRVMSIVLAPVSVVAGVSVVVLSAAPGTGGAAIVTSGLSAVGGTMAGGLVVAPVVVPVVVVGGGALGAYGIVKARRTCTRLNKEPHQASDVGGGYRARL
jgi:hypothetical protein